MSRASEPAGCERRRTTIAEKNERFAARPKAPSTASTSTAFSEGCASRGAVEVYAERDDLIANGNAGIARARGVGCEKPSANLPFFSAPLRFFIKGPKSGGVAGVRWASAFISVICGRSLLNQGGARDPRFPSV